MSKRAHYENYEKIAQTLGVEMLKDLVPFSRERILHAINEGDEHLNSLPLKEWDRKHPAIFEWAHRRSLPREAVCWVLCDTVCVLKHVARYHICNCKPPSNEG
jgi:hypothetical protein